MSPLVTIKIGVLIGATREDRDYRVFCPFLNVTSYGPTKKKAILNLKEEIDFLFDSCGSVETLAAVVDARKSRCTDPQFKKDFVKVETSYIDLPPNVPPKLLERFADAARLTP